MLVAGEVGAAVGDGGSEDLDGDGLDLRCSSDGGSLALQLGRSAGRPGGVGELLELNKFDVVLRISWSGTRSGGVQLVVMVGA
jgi:hypothetical protein